MEASAGRSVDVTDDLRASMMRDVVVFALTRPSRLAIIVLVAVLLVFDVVMSSVDAISPEVLGLSVGAGLVLIVTVIRTPFSVRRALRNSYPTGSTVSVHVGDEGLHISTATVDAVVRYASYRTVRVLSATVLVRYRANRATSVLPRVLVTDDDIGRLRRLIGEPARTPRS